MCGIAGLLGGGVDQIMLDRMTDSLAHRGPDGRGTWIHPNRKAGLGHRRLSIIDLSDAGNQPMSGASGRLQIVFNGEIYNHRELREQLTGYPFYSHSDTEVILAAYLLWGHACLEHFNGMFAFALWDQHRGELFCARDRLGVKPFYYAFKNGQMLFGSEVKALLAGGIAARANEHAWADYLAYGSYETPGSSFFDGIHALEPGHYMIATPDGKQQIRQYWSLPERVHALAQRQSAEEIAEQLREFLDSAVSLRLRSDVPVALNLTGGLDSSSVAQSFFAQAGENHSIHVFTACFDDERYDEDRYADRVIEGAPCQRHIARLSAQAVPEMAQQAMWHQEAPFGGIGTLAYDCVHAHMGQMGLKVALEGQGGDELFAGYTYFAPLYLLDLLDAGKYGELSKFAKGLPNRQRSFELMRRIQKSAPNVYQDGTDFLVPDCVSSAMHQLATLAHYPTPFSNRLDNALYRDLTQTKLQRVLRMNDRLAMAHSVELRQPFLDYRMVEFAFGLPASMKLANGWGKYILRHAMQGKLPKEITWAHKRPVVTPQREWMIGALRPWVEEIINSTSFAQRGWFDVLKVKQTFEEYASGKINNAFPIWQWINTELWHRSFVDGAEGQLI